MVYFANDNCTLQYIQVAGDDKLLGFKANVTCGHNNSYFSYVLVKAGSDEDLCTRVYTVEYLGTTKTGLF